MTTSIFANASLSPAKCFSTSYLISPSRHPLFVELPNKVSVRITRAVAKATLDALVSRGVPIDRSACVVVDERTEPTLRDLDALVGRSRMV